MNDPYLVADCTVLDPVGSSDHESVLFKLLLPYGGYSCDSNAENVDSHDCNLVYDYDNTDYVGLNSYLSNICWSEIFSCSSDVNDYWSAFIGVLNYGIYLYTPTKRTNTSRSQAKKYPLYIRQLLRKKSAAWRRYKHLKTPQLKHKYTIIKRKCSAVIKDFTKQLEERIINSANLGMLYNHVNKKLASKSGIGVLKDSSGSFVHCDSKKAELMNEYFSSVFTADNNSIPNIERRTTSELNDIVFTADMIAQKLKS